MILPAPALDPVQLSALAIQACGHSRRMAYAQLAPDLTVVQTSPNFTALIGPAEAPEAGRPLTDILWEFVGAEDTLRAVLTGAATDFQLDGINRDRADGSLAYFDFFVVPLDLAQPEAGLLLVLEDTTPGSQLEQRVTQDRNELRLTEARLDRANLELARVNRYKSFLLSMVAHDLRSPLTAIRGYADMLLGDVPARGPGKQRRWLATISALTDQLNGLIDNVLDLDQIERGRLILHSTDCDLNSLARETAQAFEPQIELRQLELELDLPKQPVRLEADPARLRQILHNLLSNAIKYSDDHGHIRLAARREAAEAVLSVSDTGPGMSADQLANLFQLYYRAEEDRPGKIAGTGLGLFIVRTLVEAHHARVEVASRPGQGTTFTVRLPLRQPKVGDR